MQANREPLRQVRLGRCRLSLPATRLGWAPSISARSGLPEAVVTEALGHYGERITRLEAHVPDAYGPTKAGTGDIHCRHRASSHPPRGPQARSGQRIRQA